jgi:hypothetical protein
MPASIAAWVLGSIAGGISAVAAGKQVASEGLFDFNICTFGKVDYPRHASDLMSGSVDRMARILHEPGGTKDSAGQNASRCAGSHEIAAGTYRDSGICTVTDADGDEWVMRYETATDLAGRWVAVGGTGKYEGMRAAGEYRPVGNVPGVMAGGFKTCHHNTGTYRMK